MERNDLGEIKLICANDKCKEPLLIPLIIEDGIKYITAVICTKCEYRNTELSEVKEFSKQTRTYDHL